MKQYITAEKVKDGYLVKKTETIHIDNKTDLFDYIRHSGMKIRREFKGEKNYIVAD